MDPISIAGLVLLAYFLMRQSAADTSALSSQGANASTGLAGALAAIAKALKSGGGSGGKSGGGSGGGGGPKGMGGDIPNAPDGSDQAAFDEALQMQDPADYASDADLGSTDTSGDPSGGGIGDSSGDDSGGGVSDGSESAYSGDYGDYGSVSDFGGDY